MKLRRQGLKLAPWICGLSLAFLSSTRAYELSETFVDRQLRQMSQGFALESSSLSRALTENLAFGRGLLAPQILERAAEQSEQAQAKRLENIDRLFENIDDQDFPAASLLRLSERLKIEPQRLLDFLVQHPGYKSQIQELILVFETGSSTQGPAFNQRIVENLIENLHDWLDRNPSADAPLLSDLRQMTESLEEWRDSRILEFDVQSSNSLLAMLNSDNYGRPNDRRGNPDAPDVETGQGYAIDASGTKVLAASLPTAKTKNLEVAGSPAEAIETPETELGNSVVAENTVAEASAPTTVSTGLRSSPRSAPRQSELLNQILAQFSPHSSATENSFSIPGARPTDIFDRLAASRSSHPSRAESDLCASLGIDCPGEVASPDYSPNSVLQEARQFVRARSASPVDDVIIGGRRHVLPGALASEPGRRLASEKSSASEEDGNDKETKLSEKDKDKDPTSRPGKSSSPSAGAKPASTLAKKSESAAGAAQTTVEATSLAKLTDVTTALAHPSSGTPATEGCEEKSAANFFRTMFEKQRSQNLDRVQTARAWVDFYQERIDEIGSKNFSIAAESGNPESLFFDGPTGNSHEQLLASLYLATAVATSKSPACTLISGHSILPENHDPKTCFDFSKLDPQTSDVVKGLFSHVLDQVSRAASDPANVSVQVFLNRKCGHPASNTARSLCMVENVLGHPALNQVLFGEKASASSSALLFQMRNCQQPNQLGGWIAAREKEMRKIARSCGSWEPRVLARLEHLDASRDETELSQNLQRFLSAKYIDLMTNEEKHQLKIGEHTLPQNTAALSQPLIEMPHAQREVRDAESLKVGSFSIYATSVYRDLQDFVNSPLATLKSALDLGNAHERMEAARNAGPDFQKQQLAQFCDDYVNPRYSVLLATSLSSRGLSLTPQGFRLPNGKNLARQKSRSGRGPAAVATQEH